MFIKLVLLSTAMLVVAMLAIGVRLLVLRNGTVSATSVGDSKAMRRQKIYCPQIMQKLEDKKLRDEQQLKDSTCADCSLKEQC